MRFLGVIFILLISMTVHASRGRVLNMSAAPFFLDGNRSFISHKVLGTTCSSFRSLSHEPVCNAALLGENQKIESGRDHPDSLIFPKGYFAANIFFGDDYEILYKNKDAIEADDKMILAESLLSERDPVSFSGSANLWWRGETLALIYQPLRLTYFSLVKNQAYPDIVIHAMQEQSMAVQWGGFLNSDLRIGLQARLIDRKFVHEEFNLFDAIPEMDRHLVLRSQKLILIEPGFVYEVHGDEDVEQWRPLLTANLTNIGFADHLYDDVPSRAVLDTGFSLSPPIAFGDWELGLNYRWASQIDGDKKMRLASQYRLGLAGFLFAIDQDQWSFGVISNYRSVSAGLMYERTRAENIDGQSKYEDSGYVEFRISL